MAQRVTVFSPAARTTSQVSTIIENYEGANALHLVIDITAGTPNMVVAVKGYDATSGKNYTLISSAILNAAGTTVLKIGPGMAAVTNSTVDDYLPTEWQVFVTASGGASGTYSIGASMI